MHFQRLLLLFVASNSGKWCWDWTLPRIRAQIELSNTFVLWLQNEYEWQFCEEFAPHPGGTNDNDAHACEPNNITVQNKIIAKILPVNKFTTLKFLSLLPSMNGYFFSWLLCFALICNICLYRSVHRHGHHCHLSPLAEVRIPRIAAIRAHFLVINKVLAPQFYLSFDTR